MECEEFVQVRVTKKGHEEVGWEAMDWIYLDQNKEGWRALMNAFGPRKMGGNCLTSYEPVSVSRRTAP